MSHVSWSCELICIDAELGIPARPKLDLNVSSGEEAYQRRLAASQSGTNTNTNNTPSSSSAAKIDLSVSSGDEAWARRAAMSRGGPAGNTSGATAKDQPQTKKQRTTGESELESSTPTPIVLLKVCRNARGGNYYVSCH